MTTIKPIPRAVGGTIAALVVAALIAACGSSSANNSSTSGAAAGTGTTASRTALAACLRQHGVTLPAGRGPGAGGPPNGAPGGGSGGPPSGGPPAGGGFPGGGAGGSKLRAALKACGANFPARGRRPGFSRQAIQKYVTCVRQHGYNLPNPNFSGNGQVFPSNIRSNRKFQTASKACQSLLAPTGPAGTGTTSGA
jgi:hypothetical protein